MRKPRGRQPKPPDRIARQPSQIVTFLERHHTAIVVCLILAAMGRIVATYSVFNHTLDEPAHIACGLEWLDKGIYQWEPQHPPLARIAVALGPYFFAAHSQHPAVAPEAREYEMFREGLRILYREHQYQRSLTAARCGVLPFFCLACCVVYWWAKRYYGPPTAVVAVFLFTFLPPVLAHAGLATTDMAVTAFMGAAFLAAVEWIERPTIWRAVVLGAAIAGGILSKFSFIAFFPASVLLTLVCYYIDRRPSIANLVAYAKVRLPALVIVCLVTCICVWAGYRFSIGRMEGISFRLPAPELFQGLHDVAKHNKEGHPGYLLGKRSKTGFFLFFPVALLVKTPIGFLVLLVFGIATAFQKTVPSTKIWAPAAFAAGILGVGLFSRINIGLRHILPIYIGLSIIGAVSVWRLWGMAAERRWVSVTLVIFVVWFSISSMVSHPDYLPYFNELAGAKPENILVDSDLDWGQDMNRLGARLRAAGAEWVMFSQFIMADLQKEHGFPLVLGSDVPSPSPGWNAVSVSVWKATRMRLYDTHPEVVPWPDLYKAPERVGKSILLWYFPPANSRPAALSK